MKINEILLEGTQPRVEAGVEAQDTVIAHLQADLGKDFQFISQAGKSSREPDLIAKIHGKKTQIEIKGRNNFNAAVKIYDSYITRGNRDRVIDAFIRAYTNGLARNLEEYIDGMRTIDDAQGFPDDEGVVTKSGKIYIGTDDAKVREVMRRYLMSELKNSNDDYFAIHTRNTGKIDIYDVGSTNKALKAPRIPNIRRVVLGTYGSSDKGETLRLAIKVNFTK